MCLCSGSDFSTVGLYDHMSCRYGTAFASRLSPFRCESLGERPRVTETLSMSEISPAMRRVAEYAKYVSSSRSFPAQKTAKSSERFLHGTLILVQVRRQSNRNLADTWRNQAVSVRSNNERNGDFSPIASQGVTGKSFSYSIRLTERTAPSASYSLSGT
jgi:hypothetical protein